MFFLPFKMDINRQGIPFVTLFVCLLCIVVFVFQVLNQNKRVEQIIAFCETDMSAEDKNLVAKLAPDTQNSGCFELFESLREADSVNDEIQHLLTMAKTQGYFASKKHADLAHSRLNELSQRYNRWIPTDLSDKLAYDAKAKKVWQMITSKFAHGDLSHIFGNLLIFYIFAASVEMILGALGFLAFFFATSITTSMTYSLYLHKLEDTRATIGLSGVVIAMVVALAVMIPKAQVRCFFTVMLIYRKTFGLPAIFLASWYFFWDFYYMSNYGLSTGVNYIAHLSGAACGFALGMFYWLFKQDELRDASRHY